MKAISVLGTVAVSFFLCTGFGLPGGNDLKSSHTKKVAGVEVQAPYVKYTKFFGYVDESIKPDGKYKDRDTFYLYVWVPAAMDEIGVSMVSPAKGKPKKKKDFVHPQYKAGMKKDKKAYFDTYINFDRMDVIEPSKIKDGGKVLSAMAKNDDSSELPKNPGGQSYNSLLRVVTDTSNPKKALVRGLYRISLTSFRSKIEGSYLATIGSNVPGIKMAASLEDLHKIVNK